MHGNYRHMDLYELYIEDKILNKNFSFAIVLLYAFVHLVRTNFLIYGLSIYFD
jgi:hypothetical protein